MEEEATSGVPSPWTSASCISRLFFWWVVPLLKRGRKGNLKFSDIYDCPSLDRSDNSSEKLKNNWFKEVGRGKKASYTRAVLRSFGPEYCLNGLNYVAIECFSEVVKPILLGLLIEEFTRNGEGASQIRLWLYTGFLCFCLTFFALNTHRAIFHSMRMAMRVRIACSSLLYRKTLKLSQASLGNTTVGQMVNLLSNDVNRLDKSLAFFPYLIVGPMQAVIVTVVLWTYIDFATLAGVAVLILTIPFQTFMGGLFSKLRLKTALLTDERIRLMNEIIGGMRVIKMYGWEFPFADLVDTARKRELSKIRSTSYLQGVNMTVYFVSSKAILLAAFAVFVLGVQGDLTPEKVFVSIGLYSCLQHTMTFFFPFAISNGAEVLVTFARLQKFLLLEEKTCCNLIKTNVGPGQEDCEVCLQNMTASWNKGKDVVLKKVSFSLRPGELLAVVGRVGCGKTSLLMSMLGELPIESGECRLTGRVSYASQEPWIFNGTVRQNILFFNELEKEKYKKIISVCALDRDLELLSNGDQTMVGERGVSLSGGQRARVNLARAIYIDADIILLDDPLSAVDASVSNHLFQKCINGYLKNKIRILATHQIQFLKEATKILVLKEGRCFALGTYDELVREGVDFGTMLQDYEQEKKQRGPSDVSVGEDVNGPRVTYHRLCSSTSNVSNISLEEPFCNGTDLKLRSCSSVTEMLQTVSCNGDIQVTTIDQEEVKSSGSVNSDVYSTYLKAGGNFFVQSVLFLGFVSTQLLFNGSDFWLTGW